MQRFTLTLVVALLVSSCGSSNEGYEVDATAPDAVILEVRDEGGFVPIEFILGQTPRYVLTADRVLYHQGVQPAIYPGPLVPSIQASRVPEDDWRDIMRAIDAAGLPDIDEVADNGASDRIADASTTVVTLFDTNGEHRYSVYALGIEAGAPGTPVVALEQLIADLEEVAFGAAAFEPFEPERYEIRVSAGTEGLDPQLVSRMAWPLPSDPAELAPAGGGWGCDIVAGADVRDFAQALIEATQATVWTDGDGEYRMIVVPLFPHQTGCTS